MKGLTDKYANKIFITNDMSIEDIDIFVKEIISDNYNDSLSYDEIFKNTISDINKHGIMVEAMLYLYDDDTIITVDDADSQIDDLYSDIKVLLMDDFKIGEIGMDINAYLKNDIVEVVDYDIGEYTHEICGTYDMSQIDFDNMYEKMKQKYGACKIIYSKEEFQIYLQEIVDMYDKFINIVIRERLNMLSKRYGNKLTNVFYKHSNWKGNTKCNILNVRQISNFMMKWIR